MGMSTNAILAYGYDLGEDFDLDEFAENAPGWYDEDNGFDDSAEEYLLAASGFTEQWTSEDADGYRQRKAAARARLGVTVVAHCSGDYPQFIVAAVARTARRGSPVPVDFDVPYDAKERIRWAFETLGLPAPDGDPQWLLASYWSD